MSGFIFPRPSASDRFGWERAGVRALDPPSADLRPSTLAPVFCRPLASNPIVPRVIDSPRGNFRVACGEYFLSIDVIDARKAKSLSGGQRNRMQIAAAKALPSN